MSCKIRKSCCIFVCDVKSRMVLLYGFVAKSQRWQLRLACYIHMSSAEENCDKKRNENKIPRAKSRKKTKQNAQREIQHPAQK